MFSIGYKKFKKCNLEEMKAQSQHVYEESECIYQPFDLEDLQAYNPIYSRFFDMTPENYNQVSLNQKYQVYNLQELYDENNRRNANIKSSVFVKFSPLLDPLKFVTGKYKLQDPLSIALPCLDISLCNSKIGNVNNCSYVDAFFSYLSNMLLETHRFIHAVPFYGSALAIQKHFRFNIADDMDFVKDSEYFLSNIGKRIILPENTKALINDFYGCDGGGSRRNKQRLQFLDADIEEINILDDIEVLANEITEKAIAEINTMQISENIKTESDTSSVNSFEESLCSSGSSCSDDTFSQQNEDTDESVWETEDESVWETESESCSESESEYLEEEPIYCYLKQFPVQLIFQEKCDGTLEEIIMKSKRNSTSAKHILAALFQVTMTLLTYQKAFDFTHNDLHTNNIMYVKTDIEYLYYKYNKAIYRVPTYGHIYKIIDFGRAIYRFSGKTFCSDSFASNGDAYSQYNCEPFMNENKPRIEPNLSFDLCRLACSMRDFYDDEKAPDTMNFELNMLSSLVREWCQDDDGRDVVYKSNGQERYPNFKLYKMIARTVHKHVPKTQLKGYFADAFLFCGEIPPQSIYMNLDDIPKYTDLC